MLRGRTDVKELSRGSNYNYYSFVLFSSLAVFGLLAVLLFSPSPITSSSSSMFPSFFSSSLPLPVGPITPRNYEKVSWMSFLPSLPSWSSLRTSYWSNSAIALEEASTETLRKGIDALFAAAGSGKMSNSPVIGPSGPPVTSPPVDLKPRPYVTGRSPGFDGREIDPNTGKPPYPSWVYEGQLGLEAPGEPRPNEHFPRDPLGVSRPKPPTKEKMEEYFAKQNYLVTDAHQPKLDLERASAVRQNVSLTHELRQTYLVISPTADRDERPTLGVIEIFMGGFNLNHEILYKTSQDVPLPALEDGSGNPLYAGIVLTDGGVAYYDTGLEAYQSVLTVEEWDRLHAYCARYQVRTVLMFHYPQTQPGMLPPEDGTSREDVISFDQETVKDCDPEILAGMKPDVQFPLAEGGIWHYPCYTVPVTDGSGTEVVPLMRFVDGSVAAAIVRQADGREELQLYFDAAFFTTHGLAVGTVWSNWLTRGQYSGLRRVYLSTQIDDFYLSTETWYEEENRPGTEFDGPPVRVVRDDLDDLVVWQAEVNERLTAPGSLYVVEQAYNGYGVPFQESLEIVDVMFLKSLEVRDDFYWVSHTWTHLDLTCPDSNCTANGFTSYPQAYNETFHNIEFAETRLFSDVDTNTWPTYSPDSMVTPKISGLVGNGDSLQALWEGGIRSVVGDNSRVELIPDNKYHGIHTTEEVHGWPKTGYPGATDIFIIPRYATRVFFNVHTPVENVAEHDYLYGPAGIFPYFSWVLSMEEILDLEGVFVANLFLQYRPDPYMFHQANLYFFEEEGGGSLPRRCLTCWWTDVVLEEYSKYFETLPIVTLRQDDQIPVWIDRENRDACQMTATFHFVGGVAEEMSLESIVGPGCVATRGVVTGAYLPEGSSWPADFEVESFGPDQSVWVPLNPGQSRRFDIEPADNKECYRGPDDLVCRACFSFSSIDCYDIFGDIRCYNCVPPRFCPTPFVLGLLCVAGGLVVVGPGRRWAFDHLRRLRAEARAEVSLREQPHGTGDDKVEKLLAKELHYDREASGKNPTRAVSGGDSKPARGSRSSKRGRGGASGASGSKKKRTSRDSKLSRGGSPRRAAGNGGRGSKGSKGSRGKRKSQG